MYKKFFKRFFSIVLCVLGLLLTWWVYLILFLAIKIDDPGPALFKQKRIGKDKKYFYILKFRSMRMDTPHDIPTHLLEDPDRYITRIGRFLRKYSLDELPQVFNVLKGDMAFVGPRPALWNQYDLIEERDKHHAHGALPGITGWAQIHGRDELTIEKKAELDGWYVQHQSFWLDVKCLFGTVLPVLLAKGVVEGSVESSDKEE